MRKWALLAGVCAAVVGGARDTRACGMGFDPSYAREMRIAAEAPNQGVVLDQAELMLANGRFEEAAFVMRSTFALERLDAESAVAGRVLHVLAQIAVRRPLPLDADDQRLAAHARQLDWAIGVLTTLATEDAHPAVLSDLGEALAQRAEQHDIARYLLENLAARDLLTSPEGWAALGRLRAGAGDAEASRVALGRCQLMTGYESACTSESEPRTDS